MSHLHEQPGYGDTWHAYECFQCGAVFDVRTKGFQRQLPCPVCSALANGAEFLCDVRATWQADEDGFKGARPGDRS